MVMVTDIFFSELLLAITWIFPLGLIHLVSCILLPSLFSLMIHCWSLLDFFYCGLLAHEDNTQERWDNSEGTMLHLSEGFTSYPFYLFQNSAARFPHHLEYKKKKEKSYYPFGCYFLLWLFCPQVFHEDQSLIRTNT